MKKKTVAVIGAIALGTATAALAGTGDTDFQAIVDKLTTWSHGTLGKVISLSMFVVGLAAGVMQQSIMAAVVGVAGAVALQYGTDVITGLFTALV